jgi:cell division protein FtsL
MSERGGILALLLAVLLSAISVVWARHEARVQFVTLQAVQAERDELNVDWGRLQLEQSAWATKARIERAARVDLGMQRPEQREIVVVKP